MQYQVCAKHAELDSARANALRSAAAASRETLRGLQAKRWMIREDITSIRDAHRIVKIAHLVPAEQGSSTRKLNPNQEILLARLASSGGSRAVDELNGL